MGGDNGRQDDLRELRKYVVIVILGLLIFVTIGNYIDDLFMGDKFDPGVNFYLLVAGIITGVFTGEAVALIRRK